MKIWSLMIQSIFFSESEVLLFDSVEKVTEEFNKRVDEVYKSLYDRGWTKEEIQECIKENDRIEHDGTYFYCGLGNLDDEIAISIGQHEI